MTSKPTVQQRGPESPGRATLLELFFDLVYVVALALISQHLAADPTWRGAFDALLLMMAAWWVWSITALVTDYYDPQRPAMQVLTIAVAFGSLLMAAAIPDAFGDSGLVFAGSYVVIHVGRGLFLVPGLRGQRVQLRAMRIMLWFMISAVPWIAGGVADGVAREVLWALALMIDYGASALRYRLPRLGPIPAGQYNLTAEHLGERYQQFFIIALGDGILVSGMALSRTDLDNQRVAAFVLAFATTVLLWRIYVHRAGEVLATAIERSSRPERFISTAPLTQLVMAAGAVATAAGFKLVIDAPASPATAAKTAILLGAPALFLIGRARFEYEVFSRVSPNRLIGLVGLAGSAPLVAGGPLIMAQLAAPVVLVGIAAHDTLRSRAQPPEEPRPPM
ncbi:MAG TPA: low temperature requirement protein A [Micromonosporaceae bacterium]|nr:low temperature requirement protein A [Micromonosporaceae bacterium]